MDTYMADHAESSFHPLSAGYVHETHPQVLAWWLHKDIHAGFSRTQHGKELGFTLCTTLEPALYSVYGGKMEVSMEVKTCRELYVNNE